MKFGILINNEKPVLVDFFATWCGPCKMMPPILQTVKKELGDKVKIVKIDVDKNQTIANKFNVRGVPTLMIFKNKEVLWRQSGVIQATELIRLLDSFK